MPKYRPNVAGILRHRKGKILVCERLNADGAWQFPQGGVDRGEDLRTALFRELEEEIGVTPNLYKIVEERGGYRYQFANGRRKFGDYGGQEQTYFLCDFLGKKDQVCIDTYKPEFQSVRWVRPGKFELNCVPEFKRKVYRQVFLDFFGKELA